MVTVVTRPLLWCFQVVVMAVQVVARVYLPGGYGNCSGSYGEG